MEHPSDNGQAVVITGFGNIQSLNVQSCKHVAHIDSKNKRQRRFKANAENNNKQQRTQTQRETKGNTGNNKGNNQ